MSKQLVLVRHAKSDRSIAGQKDFDRSLSAKGHLDAPRMGNLLAEKNITFDAIVSSPAERAKLTAQYFCEQLKVDFDKIIYNENIYEASTRVLMNEICAFDDKFNNIIVFGHNPGMSYLAEYLTKELIGDIPTCAILTIDLQVETWAETSQGLGKLVSFDFPKE
ncbi:MAG: histidine phosphatase family protein [Bacteroidetes bacterium]|nr:MAG: histidine phosphatase family protein [Bacteroidota bacterium]